MKSVSRNVFGHVSDEPVFWPFLAKDALPEFVGGAEDEVERGGVREPGFALHFVLELAGTPAGVTGEGADFLRRGKRFAEIDQRVERMAEFEIGHDDFARQKIVRVQKAERGKLDGAAEKKGLFLEPLGQISDDHFSKFVAGGTIKDEAEGAFGIVLADEKDGALEKGAAQLPAVQQQLAFQIFSDLRHVRCRCKYTVRLRFWQTGLTLFTYGENLFAPVAGGGVGGRWLRFALRQSRI